MNGPSLKMVEIAEHDAKGGRVGEMWQIQILGYGDPRFKVGKTTSTCALLGRQIRGGQGGYTAELVEPPGVRTSKDIQSIDGTIRGRHMIDRQDRSPVILLL